MAASTDMTRRCRRDRSGARRLRLWHHIATPLCRGLRFAGLEVENLNLSQGPQAGEFTIGNVNVGQAMSDERIKHREYRDDRFVVAAKLGPQKLTLFYMLRVVTPGTFTVPASFAEDMYRPELRGVGSLPSPITVVDPKGAGK